MEGKIVKNKIKMAVYAILAVGCLYMAKISFKNNKRKNQSQRIMKISYNEKHITTQGEDFRCMICRMNQKNIILHPCSHLVMCKVCLQNNKEKVKSCPLCKHHYTETIEILIP